MKKFFFIISLTLLTISSLFYISHNKSSTKPEVLVTIAPYKYFVERLTEKKVVVRNLVPEEADPHGFSPSAKELMDLFSAKIWFLSGEPFEGQFVPILKKNNPNVEVVDLKDNINLLHVACCHHHHVEDLHFWMSPKIAQMQCQKIARLLKTHFPELSDGIDKQLVQLDLDFERVDGYLKNKLKDREGSSFLVSHPAFGYFSKEYGLHQLALENEGQDPSPKEFAELLVKVKEKKIQNLYVQKQYNYKASEQLARAQNLKMIEVNPYSENYFENMMAFGDSLGGEQHD